MRDRVGKPVILSSAGKEIGAVATSRKPGLLIDIESKLRQGKGEGYARWARLHNLKQMAQTLLFIQEHGFTGYGDLQDKASAAAARFNDLSGKIKLLETEMKSNADLQTHIINYSKTRKVYEEYRRAGYSKKFKAAHATDILLYQAAKEAFDALGYGKGKKIPTIKTLRAQYAIALEEKKKAYAGYRAAKAEMRELLAAREYADRILNAPGRGRNRDTERTEV